MEEEKRICQLNKKILKNNRKIKNLEVSDNIIGFFPAVVLAGTITGFYIKYYEIPLVKEFFPVAFYFSLVFGCLPGAFFLPMKRTILKKEKLYKEVRDMIDELHGYAIEEDKKIMQKKI